MINRVTILGTGLIGASVGLALKQAGFPGEIIGWDKRPEEAQTALTLGALTAITTNPEQAARDSDVVLLATPVLAILDWIERLAPHAGAAQLITDVGSTKLEITDAARRLCPPSTFLPGHPMAGKESGGAANADPTLFAGATWLFTPIFPETELTREWRDWVARFGAHTLDLDPARHDKLCAWVSHLPQMVATALAALLEDELGDAPEVSAIGGRALREMTRLGASPYTMWRDIAMTNTKPVAATLYALEQRLAHLRENLKTPELRDEFARANAFPPTPLGRFIRTKVVYLPSAKPVYVVPCPA